MKTIKAFGLRSVESTRGLSGLAVAAVCALIALAEAPSAQAQVAARVESQTRPDFGLLLSPPVNARPRRQPRRWSYGDYRPDWRPDWRPGGPGHGPGPGGPWGQDQDEVVVDCGGNPGSGAVEDAVRHVRPGGTLVIRARGGACVGWLNVDRPITIRGEGGFSPQTGQPMPVPTLQAPDGRPCITVTQGVRVNISGLNLASPKGGDAACVVGEGADIIIRRVTFQHVGDEAAIYLHGGLLDIRESSIDARTVEAAIIAEAATLTAQSVTISNARSGIEIEPGAGGTSSIWGLRIVGIATPDNFGPRAIGVLIGSRRQLGRVEITNSTICGYTEGVVVEGASVQVKDSRICRTEKGATLYSGELSLANSHIRARNVGVSVSAGRAVVIGNVFAGMGRVFDHDSDRAVIDASNNQVWSPYDVCRPQYREVHRRRYAPYWDEEPGSGYRCQSTPYPRQWWQQEDGSLGAPYVDEAYSPPGYNYFTTGWGWYDRDGGYVPDDRHYDRERWGQRNPPRPRDDRYDRRENRNDQRDDRRY